MARDINLLRRDIVLENGDGLAVDRIRARLYGRADKPLLIVLGGISASRFIADGPDKSAGWWSPLIGPNAAIDLNRFQVLGLEFAPGNDQDDDDEEDGPTPRITSFDQAERIKALLAHLGVQRVAAIIGSSYGGMVALAFAQKYPHAIGAQCIISAAHQPFAMGVAWRGIQRRIVRMALQAGQGGEGLKLARQLAMTSYRSAEEFDQRFTGRLTGTAPERFDVCDYLIACGDKFAATMPARRFLALSESLDLHKAEPESISAPTLLIASRSDQLVPPAQMQDLQSRLGGPATLTIINSLYGHDAFLKETEALAPILNTFIRENCHDL